MLLCSLRPHRLGVSVRRTNAYNYRHAYSTTSYLSISDKKTHHGIIPSPSAGTAVEVQGYYCSRGFDLRKLSKAKDLRYSTCTKHIDSKSITFTLDSSKNEHITIFNYGSIVLFNVPQVEHSMHLETIKEVALVTPLGTREGKEKKTITDNYRLMIHPNMQGLPSCIKAEHLNIKQLDIHYLTIVATVMAQTVSLDYYADFVDDMLESFMKMNLKVEHMDGSKSAVNQLDKQLLYKLVASNNTVITNVLSKLGIFEGSDASWEAHEYHYAWEALRTEFELDYRFKDLSLKLDIVKDNARFFLSILNTEKGESLEWIIIFLIAGEIVLGITTLYIEHYEKKLEKQAQKDMIDDVTKRRYEAQQQRMALSKE